MEEGGRHDREVAEGFGDLVVSLQGVDFSDNGAVSAGEGGDISDGAAEHGADVEVTNKGRPPLGGGIYLASHRNFAVLVGQVRSLLKQLAQSQQATAELWHQFARFSRYTAESAVEVEALVRQQRRLMQSEQWTRDVAAMRLMLQSLLRQVELAAGAVAAACTDTS